MSGAVSAEREFVLGADATDDDLIRHYIALLAPRHRLWPSTWDITVLSFGNGCRRLRAGADVADYVTTKTGTRCIWARFMDDYGVVGHFFRNKPYNIIVPPHLAKRPARHSEIVALRKKAA